MRPSPKYGRTYHVTEVKDRSLILLHAGNTAKDTRGCILIGTSLGTLGSSPAVLASRKALKRLHKQLSEEDFILDVYDVPRT